MQRNLWNPLTWFRRSVEHSAKPSSPIAYSLFSLSATRAGVFVNLSTAMQCSAWWSGIRLLSDMCGMLPCKLYEDTGRDVAEKRSHPVSRLLRKPWSPVTRFTYFQTLMNHALTKGNFYAEIQRNKLNEATSLAIMDPNDIEPEWTEDGNSKLYRSKKNSKNVWTAENVIHIPGLGFDGLKGLDVITFAQQSLGLDIAAEGYGAAWFGDGGRPNGVLQHPGKLQPETVDRVIDQWGKMHAPGSHRPALLQEGITWNPEENDPQKAQAIETRRFQVAVVARFLRVAPHLLYEGTTLANDEQRSIEFIKYSLSPWLVLIEEEHADKLLSEEERDTHFLCFDVDDLSYADTAATVAADTSEVNAGTKTIAEVRRDRMRQYKTGTEKIRVPLNYATMNEDGTLENNGLDQPQGNGGGGDPLAVRGGPGSGPQKGGSAKVKSHEMSAEAHRKSEEADAASEKATDPQGHNEAIYLHVKAAQAHIAAREMHRQAYKESASKFEAVTHKALGKLHRESAEHHDKQTQFHIDQSGQRSNVAFDLIPVATPCERVEMHGVVWDDQEPEHNGEVDNES